MMFFKTVRSLRDLGCVYIYIYIVSFDVKGASLLNLENI